MSFTLWFTGLPGAGKTTVAKALAKKLGDDGRTIELLESDDWAVYYRDLLPMDTTGRQIIARSMAVCAEHLNRQGIPVLATATLPLSKDREGMRRIVSSLIFVHCHIREEMARQRDPKGLYALAAKGLLADFPGPGGRYEPPLSPDVQLNTEDMGPEQCVTDLIDFLRLKGLC